MKYLSLLPALSLVLASCSEKKEESAESSAAKETVNISLFSWPGYCASITR